MTQERFAYQALTRAGEKIQGEIEAVSDQAAIAQLQASGHWPIHVRPISAESLATRLRSTMHRSKQGLSAKALASLIDRLAMLVVAGIAVEKALEIEARTTDRIVSEFCDRLRERLRRGIALSAALDLEEGQIAPTVISMVRAGEAGGFLGLSLSRLAVMLARDVEVAEKIRTAMAYPRFLLFASGIFIFLILGLVIPQFRPLFEEARVEPPLVAAALFAMSRLVEDHLVLIGLLILAGTLAWRSWRRTPGAQQRLDSIRLRLPLLRDLTRAEESGRFCRTLATLTVAKVPLPQAVQLAAGTVRNLPMREALASLPTQIAQGKGLNAQLRLQPLLPPVAADLVQVGEETGKLSEMLERAATLFERDAETRSTRLTGMMVPAVTIGLGLVVAVMVGAVVNLLVGLNELAG